MVPEMISCAVVVRVVVVVVGGGGVVACWLLGDLYVK